MALGFYARLGCYGYDGLTGSYARNEPLIINVSYACVGA